jgi:hypothetical protein
VAAFALAGAALLGTADPTPDVVAGATEPASAGALEPTRTPPGTGIPAVWPAPTEEAVRAAATDPALLDPVATARAYLLDRLRGGAGDGGVSDPGLELAPFAAGDPASGTVAYTVDGGAGGEVALCRLGGEGSPWYVAGATTDRLRYDQSVAEGQVVLRLTSEVAGNVAFEVAGPDGEVLLGGSAPAEARGAVTLGTLDREGPVTVRARVETADGTLLAHLEVWAEPNPAGPGDPADPGFPGVWPVADEAALAALRADVTAGRAEPADPGDVARAYLEDQLGLVLAGTDGFAGTGPLDGQVAFSTEDGASGTVQLARLTEAEDDPWFVTGVAGESLQVVAVRTDGGGLVVEAEATVAGTLTGAAGPPDGPDLASTPAVLERPGTTSVAFPGLAGPAVVELRLRADDGATSVAVVRV